MHVKAPSAMAPAAVAGGALGGIQRSADRSVSRPGLPQIEEQAPNLESAAAFGGNAPARLSPAAAAPGPIAMAPAAAAGGALGDTQRSADRSVSRPGLPQIVEQMPSLESAAAFGGNAPARLDSAAPAPGPGARGAAPRSAAAAGGGKGGPVAAELAASAPSAGALPHDVAGTRTVTFAPSPGLSLRPCRFLLA